MIGTRLDKYEILEKVGEGGMATVYRGRHTTLDREVAIKVMHPHLTSSEKNRIRFEREAQAIESLKHPNILRIFDYSGQQAEQCFIITEFIDGPSLREVLDDVGLMMSEPAALVAHDLCGALAVAHSHGMVHRDVKPDNVMITRDGRVKLMDFGIARLGDDSQLTLTGALVGSPAYMSPEQASDERIDARSDVFAVGTVLYRLVTGTLPFRGGNPSIVLKGIIDCAYEAPQERVPSLSPALGRIISRCLQRSPSDRYADAGEVREDLATYLAEVGIDPEDPGRWSIERYLSDPEAYEEELLPHLIDLLLARGRAEAEGDRTAAALSTFNRVLSLDEDNSEVLEIIGTLRAPVPTDSDTPRRNRWLWALPPALAAVGLFVALRPTPPPQDSPYAALPPAPQLTVEFVPALPPEPLPQPTPKPTPAAPVAAILRPVVSTRPPPTPTPTEATGPGETGPPAELATAAPTPEDPLADIDPQLLTGEGTLKVVLKEGWSRVAIDGQDAGFTPFAQDLPAGQHVVELPRTEFHRPERYEVLVLKGQEKLVTASLRRWPSILRFTGFPNGARLRINGADRGALSQGRRVELPEHGEYLVEVVQGDQQLLSRVVRRSDNEPDLLPGRTLELSP